MQSGLIHYTLLGVYCPPVGTQQGITNKIFTDDLTGLLTEVVFNHNNLIIQGDINIHLNKPEDTDAKAIHDTLEAFKIMQPIKFPIHNLGHTLDTVATDIRKKTETIPGPYISDHQLIAVPTGRQKPQNRIREIEDRRIMDDKIQKFKDKFNNQPILDAETLKDAVYQLDNQLQNTLEGVVPLITKKISRHKKPWYEKQLNNQGKILKNRVRK